eukprot:10754965-Alexandrium_andersonii.AAC.1
MRFWTLGIGWLAPPEGLQERQPSLGCAGLCSKLLRTGRSTPGHLPLCWLKPCRTHERGAVGRVGGG